MKVQTVSFTFIILVRKDSDLYLYENVYNVNNLEDTSKALVYIVRNICIPR